MTAASGTAGYMLDTSTVIEFLRGRGAFLAERLDKATELAVSSVTAMELYFGVERSRDPEVMRQNTDQLLWLLDVKSFDQSAAREAGRLRANLAAQGQTIGPFDSLIAGHALALNYTVVTHNLREFRRVPGLACEDWLS